MLSQAAALSPLWLGKAWSAAWRTWAEISFGSRGIFEWFWLFEDPGILNSQLCGFLRKTKVSSSPRTFYIQITFLFSEWIVNENGFNLEHFLLFTPNVWPFVIPRVVQLSTSLSTYMCAHTHTSYLILFSSLLPFFQVCNVKNALLVSMEIQEFLEHPAGHVPVATTLM